MSEVSANPNMVEFPCDVYGITSDLQKIGMRCAQRVHDTEQLNLVLAVYKTLILHTQALAARNAQDRAEYVASEQARLAPQEPALALSSPRAR